MKETKYTCDHCGKELNKIHDYIEQEIFGCETADLCDECCEELEKTIKAFLKKGGE